VDAIMCGAKVVWIGPDMVQREFDILLAHANESDRGDSRPVRRL